MFGCITNSVDMSLSKLLELVMWVGWRAVVHRVIESGMTKRLN